MHRARNLPRARFQAPNGQRLTARARKGHCLDGLQDGGVRSARRSGRGREEMTSQKGVVTAPGPETRECVRRRGAAGSEEGAH